MDNTMLPTGNNFAEFLILLLLIGRGGNLTGNNSNDVSNEFLFTQGKLDGLTASTNNGFSNMQMSFAAIAKQLSDCCCETNRNIDRAIFENEKQTNNLTATIVAGNQRIIDTIQGNEFRRLENENATLRSQLQVNQLYFNNEQQTNTLVNTLRPYPAPAYFAPNPAAAGVGMGNPWGYAGPWGNQAFAGCHN